MGTDIPLVPTIPSSCLGTSIIRVAAEPISEIRRAASTILESLLLPCGTAQTQQSDQCKNEQSKMRRCAARASDCAPGFAARGGGLRGRRASHSRIASYLPLAPRRAVGARPAAGACLRACRRQTEAGAVRARGGIEDTAKIVGPTVIARPRHAPEEPWVAATGLDRLDATPSGRAWLACRAGHVFREAHLDGALAWERETAPIREGTCTVRLASSENPCARRRFGLANRRESVRPAVWKDAASPLTGRGPRLTGQRGCAIDVGGTRLGERWGARSSRQKGHSSNKSQRNDHDSHGRASMDDGLMFGREALAVK